MTDDMLCYNEDKNPAHISRFGSVQASLKIPASIFINNNIYASLIQKYLYIYKCIYIIVYRNWDRTRGYIKSSMDGGKDKS